MSQREKQALCMCAFWVALTGHSRQHQSHTLVTGPAGAAGSSHGCACRLPRRGAPRQGQGGWRPPRRRQSSAACCASQPACPCPWEPAGNEKLGFKLMISGWRKQVR